MSFEDNFFVKKQELKEEHPNTVEYKKMLQEREDLKQSIRKNLLQMRFSESEIKEVFLVIEKNYNLLENAKKPLINVTPDDILNKVEDETKSNIQKISDNMLEELRAKVVEIQARKK
ncbi:hypothetical protein IJ531_00210 [bacterium]|nr:hypothetical protein [bacterium]